MYIQFKAILRRYKTLWCKCGIMCHYRGDNRNRCLNVCEIGFNPCIYIIAHPYGKDT